MDEDDGDGTSERPRADDGTGTGDGSDGRGDATPSFEAQIDGPRDETAVDCLAAGVAAAHPRRVVADRVAVDGDDLVVDETHYDLAGVDEVLVLGGGKAGTGVTEALLDVLGDRITGGAVVTTDPATTTGPVERFEGSHPVPDEGGVAGAQRVAELAEGAGERTLVLAVITGGGSALLPAPAGEVSLADLQATTDALLASGAAIDELNAVRKHLSTLKGGGLASLAAPAEVVTLAFSDVVGNDLSVIASGPTVADDTTYGDALDVLDRYDVDVPGTVRDRLERGAAGEIPETPASGDPIFDAVSCHVLADTFTALAAARDVAADRGYDTMLPSSRIRGEARAAATSHVAVAEEALATGNPIDPPAVVLSGGECTVTIRGDGGRGGPNQEFALAAALDLPEGVTLAAVDSDGIDGASDDAGALVDADTVIDRRAARDALDGNDAGTYLAERDALLRSGPTGTNVNDLRAVVIGEPPADDAE